MWHDMGMEHLYVIVYVFCGQLLAISQISHRKLIYSLKREFQNFRLALKSQNCKRFHTTCCNSKCDKRFPKLGILVATHMGLN